MFYFAHITTSVYDASQAKLQSGYVSPSTVVLGPELFDWLNFPLALTFLFHTVQQPVSGMPTLVEAAAVAHYVNKG